MTTAVVVRGQANEVVAMPDLVVLYREHGKFVWASLYRLGVRAEDLEDMLQEVFVIVHRRLPEFDASRATFRTWLMLLCRGVAANYRRNKARRTTFGEAAETREIRADQPDPEETAARNEARRRIEAIFAEMSIEKRVTFLMYEVDLLSAEEIAEALGVPAATVYSRLYYARREFERAVRRFRVLDSAREKKP